MTRRERRELGRRARLALVKAREASPMRTAMRGRTLRIVSSGQTRNLWVGYHLALVDTLRLGRRPPFVDRVG